MDVDVGDAQLTVFTSHEQLALYRIIQEALTNVARHAHAKRVSVRFNNGVSGLHLTIRDDGSGFSSSAVANPSQHLGIEGMRQRAVMIGGNLTVFPEPQGGVTVDLQVPRRNGSTLAEGMR